LNSKQKQPELEVVSSQHVKECNGAEYNELCAQAKRGEIVMWNIEAGTHWGASRRWLWRVTYEIIKQPDKPEQTVVLPPKPETFVQVDLLSVESAPSRGRFE
jgi:hypothetical protein